MVRFRQTIVGICLFMLASCALYRPNVEICADEGKFGASCKFTRSDMKRNLTKQQWDSIRMNKAGQDQPYFCMAPESLGKYQKFIADECVITGKCKDKQIKAKGLDPLGLKQVTIPNVEICADEGDLGAFCKFTRKNQTRTLNLAQWDQQRFGWFCMASDSLAEYQSFIQHACNQEKNCIEQANQTLRTFERLRLGSRRMQLRRQEPRQSFMLFGQNNRNR